MYILIDNASGHDYDSFRYLKDVYEFLESEGFDITSNVWQEVYTLRRIA